MGKIYQLKITERYQLIGIYTTGWEYSMAKQIRSPEWYSKSNFTGEAEMEVQNKNIIIPVIIDNAGLSFKDQADASKLEPCHDYPVFVLIWPQRK